MGAIAIGYVFGLRRTPNLPPTIARLLAKDNERARSVVIGDIGVFAGFLKQDETTRMEVGVRLAEPGGVRLGAAASRCVLLWLTLN